MSSVDHKDVARRFFEEMFGKGDLGVADEIFSPGYKAHGEDEGGPDAVRDSVSKYREAFSGDRELEVDIEQVAAEQDRVVTRYTISGVSKEVNDRVTHEGIFISRHSGDNKIEESWGESDLLSLLAQVNDGLPPEWANGPLADALLAAWKWWK